MAKNTDELFEFYRRSILARQRRLTGVGEERKSPPLSGPSQGDAAAGLMKTRGATAAASGRALAEERRREEEEEGVRRTRWAGLFIRRGHKLARDSRRPWRDYLPPTMPRFSE